MAPEMTAEEIRQDKRDSAICHAHVAAQQLEGLAAAVATDFARGRIPAAGRIRILEDTVATLTGAMAAIRGLESSDTPGGEHGA
jgi:hypothetical protein